MPGTPFLYVTDSYQGASGEGIPSPQVPSAGSSVGMGFWLWLILIGVVIPVAIIGGLRVGGYQFTYRKR